MVFCALAVVAGLALLFARRAEACTSFGVGRAATADGSVLVSHSVDGWYDHRVKFVPGGRFEAGQTTEIWGDPCIQTRPGVPYEKFGEIPQAKRTWGYFHVGYPFMNEKGVVIGEHTWVGRENAVCKAGMMHIANLQALGLQRASTAREAVKVMGELAERWGYRDIGEGLIVGDGQEVWIFEIAGPGADWTPESGRSGAHWVAVRMPDDAYFVGANRARIGAVDFSDSSNVMTSSGLTDYAKEKGWWDGREPFSFAKTFDPRPADSPKAYSARREWRAMSILSPSGNWPVQNDAVAYPIFVKPDAKLTVQDLMKLYGDHMEGTPYDLTKGPAAGPFGNPSRWTVEQKALPDDLKGLDWERPISIFRCSYSFVAQCRAWLPEPLKALLWLGLGATDTTVYAPIYCGATSLPEEWSRGARDRFDPNSAWWAFEFARNWACLRWDAMFKEITEARQKLEQSYFDAQPGLERLAAEIAETSVESARTFLTGYSSTCLSDLSRRWWALCWQLVGQYHSGMKVAEGVSQENLGYPIDYLREVGFGSTWRPGK